MTWSHAKCAPFLETEPPAKFQSPFESSKVKNAVTQKNGAASYPFLKANPILGTIQVSFFGIAVFPDLIHFGGFIRHYRSNSF